MATGDLTMRPKFEQLPPLDSSDTPSSANQEPEPQASNGEWEGPPRRNTVDLNYMHRPPTILPNYGKRKGVLKLKTNVPRVLLFDNVTQQTMLDVELSCLQSQRHKADRELSMQTRSFILRRQFKQRFLKNLTKVIHGDDYWQFEQEYLGLANSDGQRKEAWPAGSPGGRHEGRFLPSLTSGRDGETRMLRRQCQNPHQYNHSQQHNHQQSLNGASSGKPGQGQKRGNPELSNARWSAAVVNGNDRKRREAQHGVDKEGHREVSLPHIRISPPQSSAPSELLQFSPPRKVGFRFQKTPNGITRIFHAHDNAGDDDEDENQHQTAIDSEISVNSTFVDNDNNENGDEKDTNQNITNRENSGHSENDISDAKSSDPEVKTNADAPQTTVQNPRPFKNFRRITNPFADRPNSTDKESNAAAEPLEEEVHREFPTTTDQPTLDHRFRGLNKLLVRQDPPNDGYIELSPSFPRDGPVNKLHTRIRELHLDAGRAPLGPGFTGLRAGSARGSVSQAATPALSDCGHSDSEGEDEHNERTHNDALLRL
ncbi:hypothetical protein EGW08_021516, partial [Elysia chlorotica]